MRIRARIRPVLADLAHDRIFWVLIGLALNIVYFYFTSPNYHILYSSPNATIVTATWQGKQVEYQINGLTLLCQIDIPAYNFTWANTFTFVNRGILTQKVAYLINKTNPARQLCNINLSKVEN